MAKNKIEKLRDLIKGGFSKDQATELIMRDELGTLGKGRHVDKYNKIIKGDTSKGDNI
jgi:hypothetical protein